MKNNYILILGIFLVMGLVMISKDSFASPVIEREEINLVLLNISDENILRSEVFNYIDLVDDTIIPNTSFNMSSVLNENYDFLTKFAISFILDNSEYYDVVLGEEYKYIDGYGIENVTNKYISVDTIYDITNQVFGVEYYYILNDYIEIENDMVPLLEIESYDFDMDIDSIIDINRFNDYMDVVVRYKDNIIDYVYRFEYVDDRLVIRNISIRE